MRSLFDRLRRWPRRHPYLTALAVLLVLLRAVAPEVLRRVMISQVGQVIDGRLEVDDVDLWLLRGAVALQGVGVFSDTSPERPIIAWNDLYVGIAWTGLFSQTIRFDAIRIDTPKIDAKRLRSGELNLLQLVVTGEADAAEEEAPSAADVDADAGWTIALDDLTLGAGNLEFFDLKVGREEPLRIEVERFEVARASLRDRTYDRDARLEVDARIEGAPVRVRTDFRYSPQRLFVRSRLDVDGLPLRPAHAYVPMRGWTALDGALDASLLYELERGERDQLSGSVTVRDFAIGVSTLERPALGWESLHVELDPVDLRERRAVVQRVALRRAGVVVDPRRAVPLPLLAGMTADDSDAGASPADVSTSPTAVPRGGSETGTDTEPRSGDPTEIPEAKPGEAAPTPEAPVPAPGRAENAAAPTGETPPAPPGPSPAPADADADMPREAAAPEAEPAWTWQVNELRIESSTVSVLGPEPPLDVAVEVSVEQLSLRGEATIESRLEFDPGSLALAGNLRLEPPGFRGTADWESLPLPRLASASGVEMADLLESGRAEGHLEIAAGVGTWEEAAVPVDSVRVRGKLGLSELSVRPAESEQFHAGWQSLRIDIADVDAASVLPGSAREKGGSTPIRVRLAEVALDGPKARLTRTAEGLVLPLTTAQDERRSASPPTPSETGKGSNGAAPENVAPAVRVRIDALRISGGDVTVVDETLQPAYRARVRDIQIDGQRVGWPAPYFSNLSLKTRGPAEARLALEGSGEGEQLTVDVTIEELRLPEVDSYARYYSGYGLSAGTFSLTSDVTYSPAQYAAETQLVLHELGVTTGSGGHLFKDHFGIPISLALALLRDPGGNITFDVPVSGDAGGTRVGILETVTSTLRRIILNAITSPLKLLGAVTMSGDRVEGYGVEPIPFTAGATSPGDAGEERIAKIGEVLSSRPELAVRVEGTIGANDRRRLAEQALLERLSPEATQDAAGEDSADEAEDGANEMDTFDLAGMMRSYLQARVAGEEATLPVAAQPLFEDLLLHQKVDAAALTELANTRARRVCTVLSDDHGVPRERCRADEASPPAVTEQSEVHVSIDVASSE